MASRYPGHGRRIKVFWFFFSKKNILLLLPCFFCVLLVDQYSNTASLEKIGDIIINNRITRAVGWAAGGDEDHCFVAGAGEQDMADLGFRQCADDGLALRGQEIAGRAGPEGEHA